MRLGATPRERTPDTSIAELLLAVAKILAVLVWIVLVGLHVSLAPLSSPPNRRRQILVEPESDD